MLRASKYLFLGAFVKIFYIELNTIEKVKNFVHDMDKVGQGGCD